MGPQGRGRAKRPWVCGLPGDGCCGLGEESPKAPKSLLCRRISCGRDASTGFLMCKGSSEPRGSLAGFLDSALRSSGNTDFFFFSLRRKIITEKPNQ